MGSGDIDRIGRLTSILIQLQSKRVVGAKEIAARFRVSLRTVYRDIRTLEAAGLPVGSQAGKGYFLVEGYRLPPVMFSTEEAGALVTAGKFIDRMADDSLRGEYASAMYKILAVMGSREKDLLQNLGERVGVFPGDSPETQPPARFLSSIQSAIGGSRVIAMQYCAHGRKNPTERSVEPLGLFYYGGQWYLHAFCRLRNAYRSFRADRIQSLTVTDGAFDAEEHGEAAFRVMQALGGVSRPQDEARYI